jgi:diguanylate cyclase (GGDEF)-like protein
MSQAFEKQNILIVDDDPMIRELLSDHLDLKGCPSRTAEDGFAALELLEKENFTIVITDLMMPRLDGMELIHAIKKNWPDTDIIAVTGFKQDFSYTDVIDAGASDFIGKPFNLNELDAKINRILRERNLREMLLKLSVKDSLTGLYNRRFFENRICEEIIRSERQGYPLYLIMVDVDNFKRVNDEQGHQEGDRILLTLADVLQQSTRHHVDIPCRYGGDEFAVIVPQATEGQAMSIAERMITNYMQTDRRGTTLSIGISSILDMEDETPAKKAHRLIKEADDAMYQSKKKGGNRITLYKNKMQPH